MRYHYMDEEEIAIRTKIKNLTAISTNIVQETGVIFLSCTMEPDVTLSFDSKSKHFPLFLDTLSKVYKREKEQRNIIIFDEYTDNLLKEKYAKEYNDSFDEHPPFENVKIDYQRYDISSIMPLIAELLSVIYAIEGTSVEEFNNLTGIRNYFTLRVRVFGKERIIPIKFMKKDDFSYNIILGNVYGQRSINASIDFTSEEIKVLWHTSGSSLKGTIKFVIDSLIKEIVEVIYEDKYIYYNENEYASLEGDKIPEYVKQTYQGFKIYRLVNNLMIAISKKESESDIHYISDMPGFKKTRNCYKKETTLDGLAIPILSSQKVIEEYQVDDKLSLIQEFFTNIPFEGEYYNETLQNKVQFRIIEDGITYYPEDRKTVGYIKSLDANLLRKVIEEMNK